MTEFEKYLLQKLGNCIVTSVLKSKPPDVSAELHALNIQNAVRDATPNEIPITGLQQMDTNETTSIEFNTDFVANEDSTNYIGNSIKTQAGCNLLNVYGNVANYSIKKTGNIMKEVGTKKVKRKSKAKVGQRKKIDQTNDDKENYATIKRNLIPLLIGNKIKINEAHETTLRIIHTPSNSKRVDPFVNDNVDEKENGTEKLLQYSQLKNIENLGSVEKNYVNYQNFTSISQDTEMLHQYFQKNEMLHPNVQKNLISPNILQSTGTIVHPGLILESEKYLPDQPQQNFTYNIEENNQVSDALIENCCIPNDNAQGLKTLSDHTVVQSEFCENSHNENIKLNIFPENLQHHVRCHKNYTNETEFNVHSENNLSKNNNIDHNQIETEYFSAILRQFDEFQEYYDCRPQDNAQQISLDLNINYADNYTTKLLNQIPDNTQYHAECATDYRHSEIMELSRIEYDNEENNTEKGVPKIQTSSQNTKQNITHEYTDQSVGENASIHNQNNTDSENIHSNKKDTFTEEMSITEQLSLICQATEPTDDIPNFEITEHKEIVLPTTDEKGISFKVLQEMNRVKNFLNNDEHSKITGFTDSGYKSESQKSSSQTSYHSARLSQASQITSGWLNQAAFTLMEYLNTCTLTSTHQQMATDISSTLAQLVDRLHSHSSYPPFLDTLLERVDQLVEETCGGEGAGYEVLKSKELTIQRLLLLTESIQITSHAIEKLLERLDTFHGRLFVDPDAPYELNSVDEVESMCYAFHVLEVLIGEYMSKDKGEEEGSAHCDVDDAPPIPKNLSSTMSHIWRKRWDPDYKEPELQQTRKTEKKNITEKCRRVLNKFIVSCMDGYSLISFAALECFNCLQS